jgi:hypothetical protein
MTALGLLVEDDTDGETLRALVHRIAGTSMRVQWRSGGGAGNIRRKGARWLEALVRKGADRVIIVHDLDRDPTTRALKNEAALRAALRSIPVPPGVQSLICIPIEEIEAWFLSDPALLAQHYGAGQDHPNPHTIDGPKEHLVALSRRANRRAPYSTNENPRLAETLNLDLCAARCPSFRDFRAFLT